MTRRAIIINRFFLFLIYVANWNGDVWRDSEEETMRKKSGERKEKRGLDIVDVIMHREQHREDSKKKWNEMVMERFQPDDTPICREKIN